MINKRAGSVPRAPDREPGHGDPGRALPADGVAFPGVRALLADVRMGPEEDQRAGRGSTRWSDMQDLQSRTHTGAGDHVLTPKAQGEGCSVGAEGLRLWRNTREPTEVRTGKACSPVRTLTPTEGRRGRGDVRDPRACPCRQGKSQLCQGPLSRER